ncbi:MAG: 50S ribosomal protein L25 [Chloroflexota bacterium]
MASIELKAEARTVTGKKVRFLRREGTVPANIYGGAGSTPIQLDSKTTGLAISRVGRGATVALTVGAGKPETVTLKDYQRHPTTDELRHVDFMRS